MTTKSTAVATTVQDLNLPNEMKQQYEMARILATSGLLPKDLNTPAKVFLVLQQGRELGLQPMQAINNIYVVNHRTAITSNLMAALIQQSEECDFDVKTWTDNECIIQFSRDGKEYTPVSFTMKDAKQAGLLGKDNWKHYPKEMLKARAMAKGARLYCADVIQGMYSVEELSDGNVYEGEVSQVEEKVVEVKEKSTAKNSTVMDEIKASYEASFEEADSIYKLNQLARKIKKGLDNNLISEQYYKKLEKRIADKIKELTDADKPKKAKKSKGQKKSTKKDKKTKSKKKDTKNKK